MENCNIQNRINKAESFLLDCIRNGLAHSYNVVNKEWLKPYPEVTGYLLSYFSNNYSDIPHKIIEASDNLINIQDDIGGFGSFDNKNILFSFDTAQILHGLLSVYKKTGLEKYLMSSRKCLEFISMMQAEDGRILGAYNKNKKAIEGLSGAFYSGSTGFSIQCKNLEGLIEFYNITKDKKCESVINKLFKYCSTSDYLSLTHPMGYFLEGLMAYGKNDIVFDILSKKIIPRVQKNGFISYSEELSYSYVSGSVQLGILLYKNGYKEQAYSIAKWSSIVQDNHESGGLFQYANSDATLNYDVHTEINSWGTKYYCELNRLLLN